MSPLGVGLFVILASFAYGYKSYDGYMVLRTTLFEDSQQYLIHRLQERQLIDIWHEGPLGTQVDFMVSPNNFPAVEIYFEQASITYEVIISNVQELIEQEQDGKSERAFDINQYNRFADIESWLGTTATSCGSRCQLINIGRSTEGRNLLVLKITDGGAAKPGLYFECGIHAREWIAPATCLNIINKLVTDPADSNVANVLSWYDIYIEPSSNPDGYEFTHTDDRLWRKTRSTNPGSPCVGTDPNRNFDFMFGGAGTSNMPCSDIYHGGTAFSEPETAAIRDFITPRASDFRMYTAVHSYGQYVLIPWSYAANEYPDDYVDLVAIAQTGARTMSQTGGTQYVAGHSANMLGATAGCSDDWAKGATGIKFAYTFELRDTGNFGFQLPPSFIPIVYEEVWAGIVAMATDLNANFPMTV